MRSGATPTGSRTTPTAGALPDDQRAALRSLVDHVASIAPDATGGTSYGVPAFRYRGKPLFGLAVHKEHLGAYPFSPEVLATVTDQLDGFTHAKGSVRFSPDQPLPDEVVTALVRGRMREIDAS